MKITQAAVAALFATVTFASTVTFGTAVPGTTEGNTLTIVNVLTIPAPSWASAIGSSSWESIQHDSTSPAIPDGTEVDFWLTFNLSGTPTGGSMGVLVDDDAEVLVNGHVIANDLGSPNGAHCSASLPNCLTVDTLSITPYLVSGVNRVDVIVEQTADHQFGLDAYGTASASATPEASSALLFALPLAVVAMLRRRALVV